ncbi:uncharacterized protein BDZ83DRAFT_620929, partial [Colletotrichum acutatum]
MLARPVHYRSTRRCSVVRHTLDRGQLSRAIRQLTAHFQVRDGYWRWYWWSSAALSAVLNL